VLARIKSQRVLQRTLKETLLLHLEVCEYTAEHELHFASFKLIIVIIIILSLCTSSILYVVTICKNLQKIHIASRTARGLVGLNCRFSADFWPIYFVTASGVWLNVGETWKQICFLFSSFFFPPACSNVYLAYVYFCPLLSSLYANHLSASGNYTYQL